MKPPVFYASGIHLRPESSGDIEILDAFLLEVYQCLMFSSNPSCQYLELRPLQWNWRQFCLGGSRCFKEVFSKCSFGLVSWDWSLGQSCLCPSFACPMCYKIQAQGGSSSSVHLAGATNFFFLKCPSASFMNHSILEKIGWNFGCLSTAFVLLPV